MHCMGRRKVCNCRMQADCLDVVGIERELHDGLLAEGSKGWEEALGQAGEDKFQSSIKWVLHFRM